MNNKKVDKKLNRIGIIILIVGIVTVLLGLISGIVGVVMFGHSLNIEDMTNVNQLFSSFTLFTLCPIIIEVGFIISVVGGVIILVSYIGEIISFADKKIVPAVQNGVEQVTPAVNRVSQSVSTGFNAAKEQYFKKD